ncbi:leucine-rich repeat-containing protein 74B [Loxodonta africana]|uniref:leucine-rich repeat-containing protein 74B n=1 Tax=Loxodonta africana TaxID=9785 RepID=UPI0030D39367
MAGAPCEISGENEGPEEEAGAASGPLGGVQEAAEVVDTDSDSDLEMEGAPEQGELGLAPHLGGYSRGGLGRKLGLEWAGTPVQQGAHPSAGCPLARCPPPSSWSFRSPPLEHTSKMQKLFGTVAFSIVPASCFQRQGSASELTLRHRGLGPQVQGAQILASVLSSSPHIKRLDLRDNGLCAAGAEALVGALSKSSCICDVDLSENQLGAAGVQALCAALMANPAVRKLQLAGNDLEEQAARYLAELLLVHTSLQSLDLSYNELSDGAGETLGPALAENSGLIELNMSWNHLRGPGAVAFARGLESNIFLKVLDISYNGFGDPGASAVGEVLKANNMLEELNMSNNRISAVGALGLGLGLRVNQTLRILIVSRNPMRSEGCFGVLKSVQDNPESALELLDFSDSQVNREFDDLAKAVKVILPGLCVKTGVRRVEYKKELLPVFRASLPSSASN